MGRIISVHEYELKPAADEHQFERAILDAERRGLLRLPGLRSHHFGKGIKGRRRGQYSAVWVYDSREAWERVWGPPDRPRTPSEYPASWRIWETEVLAPFLAQDPDAIRFTVYEEL